MNKITISDLDGTLLSTNSFTRFILWLAGRYPLHLPWLLTAVVSRKLRMVSHPKLKQMVIAHYSPLIKEGEIRQWAEDLVGRYLNKNVEAELRRKQEEGEQLLLATAAPEIYARHIAEYCGFDYLIATQAGGPECSREEKATKVGRFLEEDSFLPSLFFTDHDDDLPLSELVENQGGKVVRVDCRN